MHVIKKNTAFLIFEGVIRDWSPTIIGLFIKTKWIILKL